MLKRIFVPLTKVDAEQRLVYGVAAVEQLDKSGEIFDYDGSKDFFKAWSAEFEKLSLPAVNAFGDAAKSYGNLRQMHDTTIPVAGKIAAPLGFNDVEKTIEACAKVTDDAAWQKVVDGVYTGFSIGGDYERMWDDPLVKVGNKNAKRYTAKPAELSLVDNPCMPGATFEFIKSAGQSELRKFTTTEPAAEDLPAALYKICEALATDGATKSNPHQRAMKVLKRATDLKVDASGFAQAYINEFGGELGKKSLKKGMWDVMDVASSLSSLNYTRMCLADEAVWEDDNSEIPGRLKTVVEMLGSILVDLASEETQELTASMAAKAAADSLAKEQDEMKKFAETHKAAIEKAAKSTDPELVKMATEMAKEAGIELPAAVPPVVEPAVDPNLNKVVDISLAKIAPRLEKMEAAQAETTEQVTNLVKAFTKFMEQPAPAKVAVNDKGVTKAADGTENPNGPEVIDPKDPEAAQKVMKSIHAAGPNRIGVAGK